MTGERCNRQPGDITNNNLKLWNDFTLKHEISLCSDCLLGIPAYNMKGMIEEHGKKQCYTWMKRMSNAVAEARVRFAEDKEYISELDDIVFLIDYELV